MTTMSRGFDRHDYSCQPPSSERLGGKAYGSGRGALEDGSYVSGTFSGRWRREGTYVVVHGIDEVTNGDMSLIVFRFDARGNEVTVTHYALN